MTTRRAALGGLWVAALLMIAGEAGAVAPAPGAAHAATARFDLSPQRAAGLDRGAQQGARLPHHLLVLLVDFADQPHPGGLAPAFFDSLFFGSTGSVRDYYHRSSNGRLALDGVVSPWLRLPATFDMYADAAHEGLGVRGSYPRNARRMAEDALRAADAAVDFSRFDDDGPDGVPSSGDDDGLVDALVVVHAGPAAERGDVGGIVSHTWTMLDAIDTADGVAGYAYATVAFDSPLGTCAHEFGHLLGLPDLYQSGSVFGLGGGLGSWSLMASGSWLDDGRTPADLDAPSKLALGFVDAIVPDVGATGMALAATRDDAPGPVYRIWTHGRPGLESFVVENRQPRGLDAALPGGGMLVYHVDERAADNDDPEQPRVALLQADGREDIERRVNNGDGGDPYPGLLGRLDAGTSPSTRARDGSDTEIRFTAISPPTPNMTFDLQLESTPEIVLESARCSELAGDGDGAPEAGETVALVLRLRNDGVPTGPLSVGARSRPASDAAWVTDRVEIASLAKHDSARVELVLVPRADLGDPAALALIASFATTAWSDSLETTVGIGARAGFQACFRPLVSGLAPPCDAGEGDWSIQVLGAAGSWTLATRSGDLGSVYRSAVGPRYANGSDVALVSPTFRFAPDFVVQVLHAIDAQDAPGAWALDGGRVECSFDGGAWQPLAPRAGYTHRLRRESVPQLADAPVFSGSSWRRWDLFDLGDRAGSARVRFRFVSGDSIGGAGWEIARVVVGPVPVAPVSARLQIVAEPNPVRLPARVSFRITAPLTWSARATTLAIYDPRGRLVRHLERAPAVAESGAFVWDGTDAGGLPVASGVYFARLEWGETRAATKLLVVR